MYKYIFNSNGKYVAFILDDTFCFYPDGEYIGFFQGINLYNKQGEYLGTLTSDDRIVRNKNVKMPVKLMNKPIPILKDYTLMMKIYI
jgi:hypothetical protein